MIFDGDPPKLGTTFCKNPRAAIASITARLCTPDGARKPSYLIVRYKYSAQSRDTHCTKAVLYDSYNRVRGGGELGAVESGVSRRASNERSAVDPTKILAILTGENVRNTYHMNVGASLFLEIEEGT